MRLSVSTLTCPAWDAAKVCSFLSAVGVRHVDLRSIGGRTDLWNVGELADGSAFRKCDVAVDGISSSVRIGSRKITGSTPDGDQEFGFCVDLCSRLGGRYIRVFAGDKDGTQSSEHTTDLFRGIGHAYRNLCIRAEAYGVDVLVETHDVISSSADVLSLIRATDHPRAGIVWDIRHPFHQAGETFEYTAEQLSDVVRLVHVKDFAGAPEYELVEFGTGTVDARRLVTILSAIGYDGAIVLEQPRVTSTGKPAPDVNISEFARAFAPLIE